MFGPRMHIDMDGFAVTLKPFSKDEMAHFARILEKIGTKIWTNMRFGSCKEEQEERYDKIRKSENEVSWAIYPEGSECMVGVTSLHHILSLDGFAVSGIVIPDKTWWGKGVATRAHLARTLYAADILNRVTIQSGVRTVNTGSLKALQRVGYMVTGVELRNCYRKGKYYDTYTLSWLHPERISLLYPEGLPKEYKDGIDLAQIALDKARKKVDFD